ncbi:Hypothetical protein CINCED_3A004544 [Cinara cedri]|uniref:Uncharacterized protein n=1 Tax=Cinara cedri TaxID=506608 RepID=A0A5E4NRG2_9HEMI|nr:Hypothetical protein CINCED_3A004544 [Cinara cedri]
MRSGGRPVGRNNRTAEIPNDTCPLTSGLDSHKEEKKTITDHRNGKTVLPRPQGTLRPVTHTTGRRSPQDAVNKVLQPTLTLSELQKVQNTFYAVIILLTLTLVPFFTVLPLWKVPYNSNYE